MKNWCQTQFGTNAWDDATHTDFEVNFTSSGQAYELAPALDADRLPNYLITLHTAASNFDADSHTQRCGDAPLQIRLPVARSNSDASLMSRKSDNGWPSATFVVRGILPTISLPKKLNVTF